LQDIIKCKNIIPIGFFISKSSGLQEKAKSTWSSFNEGNLVAELLVFVRDKGVVGDWFPWFGLEEGWSEMARRKLPDLERELGERSKEELD
jgi:hypothetical protein